MGPGLGAGRQVLGQWTCRGRSGGGGGGGMGAGLAADRHVPGRALEFWIVRLYGQFISRLGGLPRPAHRPKRMSRLTYLHFA